MLALLANSYFILLATFVFWAEAKDVSRLQANSIRKAQSSTLPLTPVEGPNNSILGYTMPVTIGLNPDSDQFNLLFSTNFDQLAAFSHLLPATQTQSHEKYDFTKSQDCRPVTEFDFGNQVAIQAVKATHNITIGGFTTTSNIFEIESINTTLMVLKNADVNGIYGVGQGSSSLPSYTSTGSTVLTIDLASSGSKSLTFGNVNNTSSSDSTIWVTNAQVQKQLQIPTNELGTAQLDSTSNLVNLRKPYATDFYNLIKSELGIESVQVGNQWVVPCNANLPGIRVSVGTQYFDIAGVDLMGPQLNQDPTRCWSSLGETTEAGFSSFGLPLFNNFKVVVDYDQEHIGIIRDTIQV